MFGVLLSIVLSYFAWSIYTNVSKNVHLARCRRAEAEVRGIDLAMTHLYSDTGVKKIRELIEDSTAFDSGTNQEIFDRHTQIGFDLILHGSHAAADLKPEYRRRLREQYLDFSEDPWGHNFILYFPKNPGAIKTTLDQALYNTYIVPSDGYSHSLPFVCAFSKGKDGIFQLFSEKRHRNYNNQTFPFGDDVSNLHGFNIGWFEE